MLMIMRTYTISINTSDTNSQTIAMEGSSESIAYSEASSTGDLIKTYDEEYYIFRYHIICCCGNECGMKMRTTYLPFVTHRLDGAKDRGP